MFRIDEHVTRMDLAVHNCALMQCRECADHARRHTDKVGRVSGAPKFRSRQADIDALSPFQRKERIVAEFALPDDFWHRGRRGACEAVALAIRDRPLVRLPYLERNEIALVTAGLDNLRKAAVMDGADYTKIPGALTAPEHLRQVFRRGNLDRRLPITDRRVMRVSTSNHAGFSGWPDPQKST